MIPHTLALAVQGAIDGLLLVSLWILTTHRRAAMVLLVAGQLILLVYLPLAGQVGFWPWNLGMILVATRNWRRWSKDHQPV